MESLVLYIKILGAIAVVLWCVGFFVHIKKRRERTVIEKWFQNKITNQ